GDRSTITVPVIPTHELPILYAWSLQKYVKVPSVSKVQLNTDFWRGAPMTGGALAMSGLESHTIPVEFTPVIVCGSVGFVSDHRTIVFRGTETFSGRKACTAYTGSPQPATTSTTGGNAIPPVPVRFPAIPGWILQKTVYVPGDRE